MKRIWSIILFALFTVLPAHAISKFDLNFNFGPSLAQSGNIQDLGTPNFNTGIGFNYFFKESHGLGFNFMHEYDFEGGTKFPQVRDASISTLDVHYTFRHIMNKLHFVFEPGFGWQTLYSQNNNIYWEYYYDDLSTAWVLDYKLFLRYVLKEWDSGLQDSNGSFYLGLGIIQIFSQNDELAGRDISGSRLSALFQAGFGW